MIKDVIKSFLDFIKRIIILLGTIKYKSPKGMNVLYLYILT